MRFSVALLWVPMEAGGCGGRMFLTILWFHKSVVTTVGQRVFGLTYCCVMWWSSLSASYTSANSWRHFLWTSNSGHIFNVYTEILSWPMPPPWPVATVAQSYLFGNNVNPEFAFGGSPGYRNTFGAWQWFVGPGADLINVFEVFLPQLLLYPNPTDPLNGEAAALMMRDREHYEQKVKGTRTFCSVQVMNPKQVLLVSIGFLNDFMNFLVQWLMVDNVWTFPPPIWRLFSCRCQ